MCIYCGTLNYRKIYEAHHGPIPKDELGRSYHIHHINGNRSDNSLKNLKCVSVEEHFAIHLSQGDYAACIRLGKILDKSAEELSRISSENQKKKVKSGTHVFLNSEVQSELGKRSFKKQKEEGTHLFLQKGYQQALAIKRVQNGTNPFLKRKDGSSVASDNMLNGTSAWCKKNNPNYFYVCCLNCEKEVNIPIFHRNHETNCRGKNVKYYDPEHKVTCLQCKKTVVFPSFKRNHLMRSCKNNDNDK